MRKNIKVRQRDITDCGAACLASIAAYYQLQLPVSRIRQYAGTDKRGTNVLGLIEAANHLGFQAKGAKGALDSLAKVPLPAIVHVVLKNQLHHYLVLYKVSERYVQYMDPADGRWHKEPMADFKEKWTGVIVLLLPGEDFVKGSEKVSHVRRFWQLVRPHSGLMAQALVGAVVYTILGLSSSVYVQKIVDFVLVEGNLRLLNLMSIAMVLILLFQLAINYFKSLLGLQTGQMIDARLILGYYKHLLRLPQRFFDTMRVGEIISRVNDAVKIRLFINDVALNLIVNVLIVGFSIIVMFLYYWKLALMMLGIVPCYLLLYWLSNRINRRWQRTLMEKSAELESQLVESVNSVGTIKRFGLEDYENLKTENRFVGVLRGVYTSSVRAIQIGNGSEFVTRIFTIGILWAGSYYVVQRELTPGELLSFYALIGYFTGPAASLIGANRSIQDALIAADRLFEIIDLESEASDEQKINLTPDIIGDITFHDIHFRYGTRETVFSGLNMVIPKAQSTAIVGESGCGKSTLLSILQNIYPIQNGNVLIGNTDIKYVTNTSLRKMISVVPQQIDLFSGTIIENIAVGEYEPDVQRVLGICHLLGIHEFIEKLPNNYATLVSEQGTNFSGGQRQRIAIARALYRNPEILILDEATSSLDPASELKVQEAIQWFRQQQKTVIVIAHRFTTICQCDSIMVLDKGQLVEQGPHQSLVQNDGLYAKLWKHQKV
ncbi:MAG: peptidase domain-containing ABC transporter [Chitinophagaceae bacterium]